MGGKNIMTTMMTTTASILLLLLVVVGTTAGAAELTRTRLGTHHHNRHHHHRRELLPFADSTTSSSSSSVVDLAIHNEFASNVTSSLYNDPTSNELTSTWGVSLMLSLLYPGSPSSSSSSSNPTGATNTNITTTEEGGASSLTLEDDVSSSTTTSITTQMEMCTTMGYPCTNPLQLVWENTVSSLTTSYDGQCVGLEFNDGSSCDRVRPTVEITSSVWIDESSQINPDYEIVVGSRGYLQRIDMSSSDAGKMINDWVSNSTNGLIDTIVDSDGPLLGTTLMAINSIYFLATWTHKFNMVHTTLDTFYSGSSSSEDDGEEEDAHFMHKVSWTPYSETALSGYQMISLKFDHSDLSMIIVLPINNNNNNNTTTTTTTASSELVVTATQVMNALPELQSTPVALSLPKFEFDKTYEDELKNALVDVGMPSIFGHGFCSIFSSTSSNNEDDVNINNNTNTNNSSTPEGDEEVCIPLDYIIQKTYINVHENGTEAAAVTAGGNRISDPTGTAALFHADHPFQFFLLDDKEEIILFEGKVVNPGIPEGSIVVDEGISHEEDGFWMDYFAVTPIPPSATTTDTVEEEDVVVTEEEMRSSTSLLAASASSTSSSSSKSKPAGGNMAAWMSSAMAVAVSSFVIVSIFTSSSLL